MEVCRKSSGLLLLLGLSLLATTLQGVQGEVELEGPSESECRPYIEKALKELETGEPADTGSSETGDSREDIPTVEITTDDSDRPEGEGNDNDTNEDGTESVEEEPVVEQLVEQENAQQSEEAADNEKSSEDKEEDDSKEQQDQSSIEDDKKSEETTEGEPSKEDDKSNEGDEKESVEKRSAEGDSKEGDSNEEAQTEGTDEEKEESKEEPADQGDDADSKEDGESKDDDGDSKEEKADTKEESGESKEEHADSKEETAENKEDDNDTKEDDNDDSKEDDKVKEESIEEQQQQGAESDSKEDKEGSKEDAESKEDDKNDTEESTKEDTKSGEDEQSIEQGDDEAKSKEDDDDDKSKEKAGDSKEESKEGDAQEDSKEDDTKEDSKEDDTKEDNKESDTHEDDDKEDNKEDSDKSVEKNDEADAESDEDSESAPEEELTLDIEIPTELRPRDHVEKLLKLDEESSETEKIINKVSEITLRELKKLYENAIKPLEVLYKYRDLSNRHFGDPEIFSKPLILFMGPWSGGKSSIINYLVNNEYNETSLRTGAEPSPAYFNILMYGDEPEIIDGTELAADFTFSGLQKFGQGLEERLRGVKLPNQLLDKVNIVEIPGILEVRKQVSRVFPFNDACQWFIDRADIIFLVYDPSKLDVGPETEAILDQLKGREHQTRIILNKADQVKPEELMRVQGALIWNISPLMSSPQPPVMYTTSLWSRPYEPWAPVRLLQAQERAFLRDLRGAVDKRIENKIASARRFAVRVRNHAKMVDCYLTTYYNHKSVFGNRKQVADEIIEHPQDYHIYEGLSTLTNISRYDLPDPEVYKDFFKLNPLYEFQQLSATCTYFRGCPINRLDVAIAYDLPELVGTHKKLIENALAEAESQSTAAPGS